MADPASERGALETVTLAGLGAVALVAERVDGLAEELSRRLGVERDDVRSAIGDVLDSWRREAGRLGESTGGTASRLVSDLGMASQEAVDDLSLRVAQIEHRLKLLERASSP
jgi:polyhydroxyalkanoate synthesis regulator phasin